MIFLLETIQQVILAHIEHQLLIAYLIVSRHNFLFKRCVIETYEIDN